MEDFGFNAKGFIGIDTETTGLDFNKCQVIQIGAVFCDKDLNVLHEQEWNIRYSTDYEWDEGAEKVHNIPIEVALAHETEFFEFRDEFKALIKEHYGSGCLKKDIRVVAANTYFDYMMLMNSVYHGKENKIPFSHRLIDVNSIGWLWGQTSLHDNMKYHGVTVDESKLHSALYDAQKHMEVFSKQFSRGRDMRLLEEKHILRK
jgi:oligoribonuclease (3'-5' exoribonuclease)